MPDRRQDRRREPQTRWTAQAGVLLAVAVAAVALLWACRIRNRPAGTLSTPGR